MDILKTLLEDTSTKPVVVYGGRFQPMHPGHFQAYQKLVDKFGKDNVWIATSNKTEEGTSPLSFKDKKKFIITMFDVQSSRIVLCKNPAFAPIEITKNHPNRPYIAVVGEKDLERYQDSDYFKPYKAGNLKPAEEQGYYFKLPILEKGISGTVVRKKVSLPDEDVAFKAFQKIYSPKRGAREIPEEIQKNVFDYLRSKLI